MAGFLQSFGNGPLGQMLKQRMASKAQPQPGAGTAQPNPMQDPNAQNQNAAGILGQKKRPVRGVMSAMQMLTGGMKSWNNNNSPGGLL